MAYNRKMRKFEGTCYIPGEQLAMMAKYYRGANLNLNLTLYEDDIATMQETLDQACWCSKLDEVDRMKMAHMKGNEWRIAHDHCTEKNQHGHDGRSHQVYPALPQRSRSTVGKVERGTSTLSLYDRERGLVRGGRYQRDTYSEPRCRRYEYYDHQYRRGDYYDHRNPRVEYYDRNAVDDFYDPQNRQNDNKDPLDGYSEPQYRRNDYWYDRQNRKDEYNDRRFRKNYYLDQRSVREEDDGYSGQSTYHAQHALVDHSERRPGRFMRTIPDRRHEMESEAGMYSLPEVPEIRCAVCNLETCLVCKNHLYNPTCQCKCLMANAGLCNKCRQEPCEGEEAENEAQEARDKKTDMTSMMLTMMMSSMLNQFQAPESACCCKPSRYESETSVSDPSDEKVQTVYVYNCQGPKEKAMADVCFKCSEKSKKNPEKRYKVKKDSSGEGTNESDSSHTHQSSKKKGNEDSKKNSSKVDSNSGSVHKLEGDQGSNMKPAFEKGEASQAENPKSDKNKDGKSKFSGMDDRNESLKTNNGISGGPKVQQNTVNTNMESRSAENISVRKSQGANASEPDRSKVTWRLERPPQKSISPVVQLPEKHDSQNNLEDFKPPRNNLGEESSTTIDMREFIVCLPKIQSNLQSLMYKLNQMDILNNHLQFPQIDPSLTNTKLFSSEMQIHHDVPQISSPQNQILNSSRSLFKEQTQLYNNKYQKPAPGNSCDNLPCSAQIQNLPSTISLGSSKDEPKVHEPSNTPTRYHSVVNFPNLGGGLEANKQSACRIKQVPKFHELIADPTQGIKSTLKCSPLVGGIKEKDIIEASGGNQRSFQKGYHTGHSSSLINRNIDQNILHPHLESWTTKFYLNAEPGNNHHYQQGNSLNADYLQPLPKVFSPTASQNFDITGSPETTICNQGNTPNRKFTQNHYAGTVATTLSPFEGETIFQRYNHESSATLNQDTTDYVSFTDENCFKLPPEASSQQSSYDKGKDINDNAHKCSSKANQVQKHTGRGPTLTRSEFSRSQTEKHISRMTRSVLKVHKGVAFKAKQKSPLSLEKLVQGCTLRGGKAPGAINNLNLKSSSNARPKRKLHNKRVGPGKFRRLNLDSSLYPLRENITKKNVFEYPNIPQAPRASVGKTEMYVVTPNVAGVNQEVIPLKNKSSGPVKEKARHTLSMNENKLSTKTKMLTVISKVGIQNPPDCTSEQMDLSLKMPVENIGQEMSIQSCIVTRDEVRCNENSGSSAGILKMMQGITSSSLINMRNNISSVPPQNRSVRMGNLENIPLIPLTTTVSDGSESGMENQSESTVEKPVLLDYVSSSTTPNVLKKSRVQVEQLKRAHETIRSMIKNVNAVIAHIDSDSKIGIKSKVRREDKERRSYFVYLGDDKERQNHSDCQERRNDATHFEKEDIALPGTSSLPGQSSDVQSREVQEMFLSVNRVINSVMTPSEPSNETQQPDSPIETPVPTRAHRDFYLLSSESSANAFVETLRRSLENETSRSIPLATQRSQISERVTSPRQRMTRPLKRRSWFPPPKQ